MRQRSCQGLANVSSQSGRQLLVEGLAQRAKGCVDLFQHGLQAVKLHVEAI